MELAVELPSPPQFLPVPGEIFFKPIPFGGPTSNSLSVASFSCLSSDDEEEELRAFIPKPVTRYATSPVVAHISPEKLAVPSKLHPLGSSQPLPSAVPLGAAVSQVVASTTKPISARDSATGPIASSSLSPSKRIEKPKAQLPAFKKIKDEKVLVRYSSASALVPKGQPLPLTSAHYLSILRDTSKVITQP